MGRSNSSSNPARTNVAPTEVQQILTSRPVNYIHDTLSPTPLRLLERALDGYLDGATLNGLHKPVDAGRPSWASLGLLPQCAHLIYFPQETARAGLLRDGCDDLHFPGEPWVRRMWAGGCIDFAADERQGLLPRPRAEGAHVLSRQAVCRESVGTVKPNTTPGREKVFVEIERLYGAPELEEGAGARAAAVVERRDLVFMKAKTPEEVSADLARPDRVIRRMLVLMSE